MNTATRALPGQRVRLTDTVRGAGIENPKDGIVADAEGVVVPTPVGQNLDGVYTYVRLDEGRYSLEGEYALFLANELEVI